MVLYEIDERKLSDAIKNSDVEKVKSILIISNKNKIILNLNKKIIMENIQFFMLF